MIVLRAKAVEFDVTYINLRDKPQWFLDISPHGKVPVLNVDGSPLFESNAIAEFLDEAEAPRLHPEDPIKRARNRAWTDFVPTFSPALSGMYYAKTPEDTEAALKAAPERVAKLEEAIATERGNDGPYFNGGELCLVDAAYAPFLQRFTFLEKVRPLGVFETHPLIAGWRDAVLDRKTVQDSTVPLPRGATGS